MPDDDLDEYGQLLQEYVASLREDDHEITLSRFERAAAPWARICDSRAGEVRWKESTNMHLVLTFSHAAGAGHEREAERIYNLMSDDDKSRIDSNLKIWQ